MAKNDTSNKKPVASNPDGNQEAKGNNNSQAPESKATGAEPGEPQKGQEADPNIGQPGASAGENGTENTGVDSELKNQADETKGSGTVGSEIENDDLSGINDEESAKEYVKGIVNEVLNEKKAETIEPKATTQMRNRISKEVFGRSDLSVIWFTSDLFPFANENDALKHANTLDEKTVTQVNKEA